MAYYTALQTAWSQSSASSGALPSGVTGTSLFGLTTAQKIVAINGWTVNSVLTTFDFQMTQVVNVINYAEFKALTATQQSNLLSLLSLQGTILGGSANVSLLTSGMLLDYFGASNAPITRAAIIALATVTPSWWSVPVASGGGGLNGAISQNDLTAAGGLT